jgi:hypothetical protein
MVASSMIARVAFRALAASSVLGAMALGFHDCPWDPWNDCVVRPRPDTHSRATLAPRGTTSSTRLKGRIVDEAPHSPEIDVTRAGHPLLSPCGRVSPHTRPRDGEPCHGPTQAG